MGAGVRDCWAVGSVVRVCWWVEGGGGVTGYKVAGKLTWLVFRHVPNRCHKAPVIGRKKNFNE